MYEPDPVQTKNENGSEFYDAQHNPDQKRPVINMAPPNTWQTADKGLLKKGAIVFGVGLLLVIVSAVFGLGGSLGTLFSILVLVVGLGIILTWVVKTVAKQNF